MMSEGIDRVRVFGLANGIAGDGGGADEPSNVLVKWRSEHTDKVHRVYVNGVFAGATSNGLERMLVVSVPVLWSSGLRVEVFAADIGERCGEIDSGGQAGRVEVGWQRRMGLPTGGMAEVWCGGAKVSQEEIALWGAWQDKGGWGMCWFGVSDFGYDGSAAVGFGEGLFGEGEFGFDSDEIVWVSDVVETGEYAYEVKARDAAGNEDGGVGSSNVVVVRKPVGVDGIAVESYDKGTGSLVIGVEG